MYYKGIISWHLVKIFFNIKEGRNELFSKKLILKQRSFYNLGLGLKKNYTEVLSLVISNA
jgi:hypothetical protein